MLPEGIELSTSPVQQQGAELQGTPWGNVLLLLAFLAAVPASTVKYRRVPLKTAISATPALPRAQSPAGHISGMLGSADHEA